MLVFAGLFSAVITTLVVQTSTMLQANPQDQVTQLLGVLINVTKDPSIPIPPPVAYSPGVMVVVINALLFSSLILSLGAGLGAMLVKQWARRYQLQEHTSVARQAARNRLIRHQGLLDWHLPDLIAWIPMVLHAALVTFFVAVILWLRVLNQALFVATFALVIFGATIYVVFAAIPLFASNAPFHWPLSSLLRSLVSLFQGQIRRMHAQLPKNQDLELGSTITPFLLTPSLKGPSPRAGEADKFDLVDASVIINLLRQTEAKEEIESALEQLRTARWNEDEIGHTLFKNGDMILQRCAEVAVTVSYNWGSNHYLRDGMRERARRICRFIEWFYYQITPYERASLKNWPNQNAVHALQRRARSNATEIPYHFNPLQFSDALEDLVLTESVLAKLNHATLGPQEHCVQCLIPEERNINNIRMILRRAEFPNGLVSERLGAVDFVESLISAFVISDADCLLHYVREKDQDKISALIKASTAVYSLTLTPDHGIINDSYKSLIPVLDRLCEDLEDSDARMLWFKRLIGYARLEFNFEDRSSSFIEDEGEEVDQGAS